MPLYEFYPCDCDSISTTFEMHELPSDADVAEFAFKVLLDHPSCDYVEVWDGDRLVLSKGYRDPANPSQKPPMLLRARGFRPGA